MPTVARPTATPPKQTRRRSQESQAELKQELLNHAKRLFREHGYEAVSIRALTDAVGMSPMSFYGYFTSKQDLVKHLWIDFFQELLKRVLRAGEGKRSALQVIEAHAEAHIAYWEEHPDHYRLVYLSDLNAVGGDLIRFNDDPVSRQIATLLRERVLACAKGKAIPEKALRLILDRLFVRALGYLHATIAVERYPFVDRAKLRRSVIKDLVEMVEQATT
jgi:AcrR family transcriptional regulator